MAIQNFISGGFYGKVGKVIGQRWHNTRYIRSYFIPFNPRTEKQQSNREIFKIATALAQEAYNINKGSPLWDTSSKPQFSQMVGVAKMRLQAGKSPAEALPLYPDGYSPSATLTAPSVDWSSWGTKATITDSSYRFTQSRTMAIEIHCKNEHVAQSVFFHDTVTIPAGSYFSYAFLNASTYSLPAGSNIQAVSTDDSLYGGSSIRLPPFNLTQPATPLLTVALSAPSIQKDIPNKEIFILFDIKGITIPFEVGATIRYYDIHYSSWENTIFSFEHDPPYPPGIFLEVVDDYTFPSGSYIHPGTGIINTGTARIQLAWSQYAFSFP